MLKKILFYRLVVLLGIALFVTLPTLVGLLYKTPGKIFTGNTFFFDPWDINVYVSAINHAQSFGFAFENMYTTENFSNNVNLYPLYTFTGFVFKNLNPYLLYYLLIILTIILFIVIINKTIKPFIAKGKDRSVFIFLLSVSGGFGWLSFNVIPSADITTTPFTFLNMLQRPHATIAVTAYIASLMCFYFFLQYGFRRFFYSIIPSIFIFSIFYPYLLLSFCLITFSYSVYLSRKNKNTVAIKTLLKIFLITIIPTALYSLYILRGSQFESVLSPNLPTPPLICVLLGHGVFLVGLVHQMIRKKNDLQIFLIVWYIISIALSYAPISFARYYLGGLYFPLFLLLFISKDKLFKNIKSKHFRKSIVVVFVLLISLTSTVILIARTLAVLSLNRWSYLDSKYVGAIKYLHTNSSPGSGVISKYPQSNFIPVYTLNKVYVGHGAQTVNSQEKSKLQEELYEGTISPEKLMQIVSANVEYVIVENQDLNLIENVLSPTIIYETAYQNDIYTILRFVDIPKYASNN